MLICTRYTEQCNPSLPTYSFIKSRHEDVGRSKSSTVSSETKNTQKKNISRLNRDSFLRSCTHTIHEFKRVVLNPKSVANKEALKSFKPRGNGKFKRQLWNIPVIKHLVRNNSYLTNNTQQFVQKIFGVKTSSVYDVNQIVKTFWGVPTFHMCLFEWTTLTT